MIATKAVINLYPYCRSDAGINGILLRKNGKSCILQNDARIIQIQNKEIRYQLFETKYSLNLFAK